MYQDRAEEGEKLAVVSKCSSKILIYAINFAPEVIGCGKYTGELAQYLASRGHEVEVVTAPPHYPGWYVRKPYRSFRYIKETIAGPINITRCPMLMKRDGGGIWRLLAPFSFAISGAAAVALRVLSFEPDVVLCVEPTLFAAPVALLISKIKRAKCVLHVQDLEVDAAFQVGHLRGKHIRWIALSIERTLLRGFDRVITISEAMRTQLIKKGVPPSRAAVVRNWVDTDRIKPLDRNLPNQYRTQLGLDSQKFVALYAGNVGPKQALDVVIAAARRLREQRGIHIVIAGEGPSKRSLADASRGLPNVSFLPLQPPDCLNELLGMADLHLLPQQKGTSELLLPSKLGPMLASGRPIVATVDPGSELFQILTGIALTSPPGDDAALAETIRKAKSQDHERRVERGVLLAKTLAGSHLLPILEQEVVHAAYTNCRS